MWKGYHLPKVETEENVEVFQRAEIIYKRLILNVFQLQADATFVKKIIKTIMLL